MIIEPSIKPNFQYKNEIKTLENASDVKEVILLKENDMLKEENENLKNKVEELVEENRELKAEIKNLQKQSKKGGE